MPQSRHRKIGKAKKRPKGLYPATKSAPPSGRNRQARIVAIMVVLAIAAAAVTYLVANRNANGGNEITTASGLKYTDINEGTGATPQTGQMLTVHYTGTLQNGSKFDSSVDRGTPYQFRIGTGTVIKGWDEGLMSMKVGGKRKLIVPPSLGYGAAGTSNIPPNSTLIFDVELLGIK